MSNFLQRLNEVIQVEATTSSVGDFLVTHKPFKNLYHFVQNEALSSNSIDEEILYDNIFHKNIVNHQFVVIQGTQGCGKSHLIRWMKVRLEEEIDKNKEAVMFISRNHNTLQDAIKQILESDIFPDEIKNNQIKKLKENSSSGYTGEELKKQIIFNLKLAIDSDIEDNEILDRRMKDMLSTFIMDNYIQKKFLLTAESPIERIRQKMENTGSNVNFDESPVFNKDDFKMSTSDLMSAEFREAHAHTRRFAEKINSEYDAQKNKEKVARYLNSKVSEVIERSEKFKTTDLKELFNSLRVELKKEGKNLILFIEDLTAFTGLDKAIVEVLVTNHQAEGNEEYCRLISVVGLTRAFYDDNIPDNLRDRITTNVLINTSNNSSAKETFFKDKDELAKFAGRYLNAINLQQSEIAEWVRKGADYSNLPIFTGNAKYEWANIDEGGQVLSIYPFNKNALWNLYFSIPENKRTPRAFLKDVLKYLLSIWSNVGKNLVRDEKIFNNGIIRIPSWSNVKNYEQDNESYCTEDIIPRKILLCIWGNQTTEKISNKVGDVEINIFEEFNVSTDIFGKAVSTINPGIEIKTNAEPIKKTNNSQSVEIVIKDKNYDKLYNEITEWASKENGQLPSHIEIRELLTKSIINTVDWFRYDIPRQLIENFSSKNINIEGQTLKSGSQYTINIERNQDTKYMLLALIGFKYKGKNSWNYDNSIDDYINYATWLKGKEKIIVDFVKDPKQANFDISLYNVLSEYYLKAFLGMINNNCSDIDIIKALISEPEDKSIQFNNASEKWKLTYGYVKSNYNPEILHRITMNYFMRLFGEESTDTVSYKFFDIASIIEKLDELKTKQFDINAFNINEITEETNLSYLKPVGFLRHLGGQQEKIVKDSKDTINTQSFALVGAIGNNLKSDEIKNVLEQMENFLLYLQHELNIPYPSDQFRDLMSGNIKAGDIYRLLREIDNIQNEDNILKNIEQIADFRFELLNKINQLFLNYANFLKQEKEIYSTTSSAVSAQTLSQIKEDVRNKILNMKKIVEEEC